MDKNLDENKLFIRGELIFLAQRLKATTLCLELVRPITKPDLWMVSDTDISCYGATSNGESIFEFNFSGSLKKAFSEFIQKNSIKAGIKFWLSPEKQLGFEVITKATIEKERALIIDELHAKYKKNFELWKKNLSSTPFGVELARAVYLKLEIEPLVYVHRDYCGTGLFRQGQKIIYCECEDGKPMAEELAVFGTESEFVNWLSQQSDRSLARLDESEFKVGNQTISQWRLNAFINDKLY